MKNTKKKGVTHIRHTKTVQVYNTNDLAIRRRQLCETVVEMGNESNSCASQSQTSQQLVPQKHPAPQNQQQVAKFGGSNGVIANNYNLPQRLFKSIHQIRAVVDAEYQLYEQMTKQSYKPHFEKLNLTAKNHASFPSLEKVKKEKVLLHEQEQKHAFVVGPIFKEIEMLAEMKREYEKEMNWNNDS